MFPTPLEYVETNAQKIKNTLTYFFLLYGNSKLHMIIRQTAQIPQKMQLKPSLFVHWTLKKENKTQKISMALAISDGSFERNKSFIHHVNFLGQV